MASADQYTKYHMHLVARRSTFTAPQASPTRPNWGLYRDLVIPVKAVHRLGRAWDSAYFNSGGQAPGCPCELLLPAYCNGGGRDEHLPESETSPACTHFDHLA